jgi:hypothetical protein
MINQDAHGAVPAQLPPLCLLASSFPAKHVPENHSNSLLHLAVFAGGGQRTNSITPPMLWRQEERDGEILSLVRRAVVVRLPVHDG